jgi:hypothetical protein
MNIKKYKSIENQFKNKVINFLWIKTNDKRIGFFRGFSKDNKYFRINRLNPYVGYTKVVKIPIKLIKIIK